MAIESPILEFERAVSGMGCRKASETKDDILLAWNLLEATPETRTTVQVGHLEE